MDPPEKAAILNYLRASNALRVVALDALANTLQVMHRCNFKLEEVRYDYPLETVLPGMSPTQTLRVLTYQGAAQLQFKLNSAGNWVITRWEDQRLNQPTPPPTWGKLRYINRS